MGLRSCELSPQSIHVDSLAGGGLGEGGGGGCWQEDCLNTTTCQITDNIPHTPPFAPSFSHVLLLLPLLLLLFFLFFSSSSLQCFSVQFSSSESTFPSCFLEYSSRDTGYCYYLFLYLNCLLVTTVDVFLFLFPLRIAHFLLLIRIKKSSLPIVLLKKKSPSK